jgi:hypothetical protein
LIGGLWHAAINSPSAFLVAILITHSTIVVLGSAILSSFKTGFASTIVILATFFLLYLSLDFGDTIFASRRR